MKETDTDKAIAELVDRGGKLAQVVLAGERASVELSAIKTQLRELANGKDRQFSGATYCATVEQKPPGICRVVAEQHVPKVVNLAGAAFLKLFTLHPSKGGEKSFDLNALKSLPKKNAWALLKLLAVSSSAWVRFSRVAG